MKPKFPVVDLQEIGRTPAHAFVVESLWCQIWMRRLAHAGAAGQRSASYPVRVAIDGTKVRVT